MFDNLFGTPSSQWDLTGGVFGTFYSLEGVERAAGPRGQSYVAYFRNIGFRTMLHRGCTDYDLARSFHMPSTPAGPNTLTDPQGPNEPQPALIHSCPDPNPLPPIPSPTPPPDYGVPGYNPRPDTRLTPGI